MNEENDKFNDINSIEDFYKEMDRVVEEKQTIQSKELKERLEKKLNDVYFKTENELKSQLKVAENYLSEVLEDYIVIGHTYAGERIKMFMAKSPKDVDSLKEAMKSVVIPILMGNPHD